METHLTKIGNSQGIIIPKALLQQLDIQGAVELTLQDGGLLIKKPQAVREGWLEALKAAPLDDSDSEIILPIGEFGDEIWEE